MSVCLCVGAERIKGYTASEIIGRHFSVFYPKEDIIIGKPAKELMAATNTGVHTDEGWRVRKDGSRFFANVTITALRDAVTGELRGFAKVTRDVTDRMMAEQAVRESEERFRLLVDSITDYSIVMLDTMGRLSSWNKGTNSFSPSLFVLFFFSSSHAIRRESCLWLPHG